MAKNSENARKAAQNIFPEPQMGYTNTELLSAEAAEACEAVNCVEESTQERSCKGWQNEETNARLTKAVDKTGYEDVNSAYGRILRQRGNEEFKALSKRLRCVAKNRDRLGLDSILIPNFIFAEAPGSGVTTHLRLLAQLLDELKLFRFQGEKQVIEQVLDYGMEPILKAVRDAAGTHSCFRGIVGLEVGGIWKDDGWVIEKLTDFARDKRGEILFVFIVPLENGDAPGALARQISLSLPVEVIRFPRLSEEDLAHYMEDFLWRRGFDLSADAREYLVPAMGRLREVKGFDGLQTLEHLADLLVFQAAATVELKERVITKTVLRNLLEERYLKQLRPAAKEERRIGFGG